MGKAPQSSQCRLRTLLLLRQRTQRTDAGAPALAETARPRELRARMCTLLILVLLFCAVWIPRVLTLDLFVTADESDWLQRTVSFTHALIRRDWIGTYQFVHPAETTMWVGSLGVIRTIPDLAKHIDAASEQGLVALDQWLLGATGVTPLELLAVTRWWVTLMIAAVTTLTFFPLRRLFGPGTAVVAILMIAWSPMMVGFSRKLQPDGFLATAYFWAAVTFLAWLYAGLRTRDLLLSGVAMGLAWLTKIPAVLLVPAGGLVVGGILVRHVRTARRMHAAQQGGSRYSLRRDALVVRLVRGYILWGAVALLVFFALFPALWVDPVGVLRDIYTVMLVYSEGHTNPNFFMGRIVNDPGLFFYPVIYYFRATPAAVVGLLLAIVMGARHLPPFDRPEVRQAAAGMLIFALTFTVAMTLIGKKFDRYLLPVFPLLLTLAAAGWYGLATAAGRWFAERTWIAGSADQVGTLRQRTACVTAFTLIIAGALTLLHGVFVVRTYPYYINYYNPLAGGNQAAHRLLFYGWGEGLEQVGAWLNQQPDASNLSAVSWYSDGPLSFTFQGHAVGVDYNSRINWLDADYLVLYVNQIQRNIPTASTVGYFLRQTPVYEVTLDGIVMARLYDLRSLLGNLAEKAPDPIEFPATTTWPGLGLTHLETLPSMPIASALPVELRFQGEVDARLKTSLRLFSDNEILVAQLDVPLAEELDVHLFVPPDALPGSYQLRLMVYDEESLEPVPTTDGLDIVALVELEVTAQ